jgi:hypothetical protein
MRDALRTLERSLAELTSFFFTLFTWTTTWLAPLVISLFEFLDLFLLLIRRSLVYFLYTRVAPLCAFCYIQHYLQKKKKKFFSSVVEFGFLMFGVEWLMLKLSSWSVGKEGFLGMILKLFGI